MLQVHIAMPCLDVPAGCPSVIPQMLLCNLNGKWVRSSEGGTISLEHRAQIPTLCFWNPVAPRSRGSVWPPLY